jgi:hypothetical protein
LKIQLFGVPNLRHNEDTWKQKHLLLVLARETHSQMLNLAMEGGLKEVE